MLRSAPPKVEELRARMLFEPFFARDARVVARALIGTILVHCTPEWVHIARIAETEAYRGPTDGACHARFGETPRTRAIFGAPGTVYCFLVYGMHDCFNVVTLRKGSGHAVLIRGATLLSASARAAETRADGPGRFARALGFTRADSARSCITPELFFARGEGLARVMVSARVGVHYAGKDAELPLRFYDATGAGVSRPPASQIGLGAKS